MKREIVCPCGHRMDAPTDADLYFVVRRHVDDEHPELNYGREEIENMIDEKAYNA